MGTNKLVQSEVQKKGGGNAQLVKALDNANEEAIKMDRKDVPKIKRK